MDASTIERRFSSAGRPSVRFFSTNADHSASPGHAATLTLRSPTSTSCTSRAASLRAETATYHASGELMADAVYTCLSPTTAEATSLPSVSTSKPCGTITRTDTWPGSPSP